MKTHKFILVCSLFLCLLIAAPANGQAPGFFEVIDTEAPTEGIPIIKAWKTVVLDKTYRGSWIVAGDLTGDGQIEIVSARNVTYGQAPADNHYTSSVVAQRLDGSVLWTWGDPEEGRNALHHDVACQIYDWDGDGNNEVVIAANRRIVELNGKTGKIKRGFSTPADSSDCLVFCNLSGNPRATDVLLKTRYSQIWAFDAQGKELWTSRHPGGYRTAHQSFGLDIDRDGRDEVLAGFSMLNHDGTLRWALKDSPMLGTPLLAASLEYRHGHLDCGRVLHLADEPEESSLILSFCEGRRLARVDGNGKFIWSITGHHFESIDIGKVDADVPGLQIVVDDPYSSPRGYRALCIVDEQGRVLGKIRTSESRFHRLIDWTGDGIEEILLGQNHCLYNGKGKKLAIFDMPVLEGEQPPSTTGDSIICHVGDMTGDKIPDVILTTVPGGVVYIYKNEKGRKETSSATQFTEVNCTLY